MITFDGREFEVKRDTYKPIPKALAGRARGATGLPIQTETGYFSLSYEMTLLCDASDFHFLMYAFMQRTPPRNLHDFKDQHGISWLVASGTDTDAEQYGTGVYIDELEYDSADKEWSGDGDYEVTLALRVNSNTIPLPIVKTLA